MSEQVSIRSLRIQASQTVDLSFSIPGVIAGQNYSFESKSGPAFLGARVQRYEIDTALYQRLSEVENPDSGKLKYDSAAISNLLKAAPYFFYLRNEVIGTSLDQAIFRRQSSYMSRFKHADALAQLYAENSAKISTHLEELQAQGVERYNLVDAAYDAPGTPAELKGVMATLNTRTETAESSSLTKTQNTPIAMVSGPFSGDKPQDRDVEVKTFKQDGTSLVQVQKNQQTASVPKTRGSDGKWRTATSKFQTQESETIASAVSQNMESTAQGLTHPRLDNTLAYHQAMVGILQEKIRHNSSAFSVGEMRDIIERELDAADQDIRMLQLNFAHSFLLSPISGIVTGVFKDIGESVEPGEPVLRIENDRVVLVIGRVQCRAPLWVGREIRLSVRSVFENGHAEVVDGAIVAIRGHEKDNDEWEIICQVDNPLSDGRPLLPINYHFDRDTDQLEILS